MVREGDRRQAAGSSGKSGRRRPIGDGVREPEEQRDLARLRQLRTALPWRTDSCSFLVAHTHAHTHTHTRTHAHPFNGPLSWTTRVNRYKKGKTNLDFTEARDSEWQWHQLGHMQACTSLRTNNHASTSPLRFYRPDALPAAQPTASKR